MWSDVIIAMLEDEGDQLRARVAELESQLATAHRERDAMEGELAVERSRLSTERELVSASMTVLHQHDIRLRLAQKRIRSLRPQRRNRGRSGGRGRHD